MQVLVRTWLLVTVLSISLLSAGTDAGARVAEKQLAFVKQMTAANLHFDSDLKNIANKVDENTCKLARYDAVIMDADQVRLAQRYASEYCRPWEQFWDKASAPCDGDRPAAWCAEEDAMLKRANLDGYFSVLASGLRSARSSLERDNIMGVVTSTLSAHVISQFPNDRAEAWAVGTAGAYLKGASPEQAIQLAKDLQATWVGLGPVVTEQFKIYMNGATALTASQRDTLNNLLSAEAIH